MKFKVINLGCKVNRSESDSFERILECGGHRGSDISECDLVVVNTCTVTGVAEKKTRKAVRQAVAQAPKAKVVVTGCAVAQCRETYEAISERVEAVDKWDMDEYLAGIPKAAPAACDSGGHEDPSDDSLIRYCRASVKIQDGCSNECTYCIVHALRGPERSLPISQAIEQAALVSSEGISEVMLSGINLGRYRDGEMGLEDLCEALLDQVEGPRFRLSSIEPNDVTERLVEVVAASNGRICRHFHLPMQSGCSKVLSEMGRNYSAQEYLELVEEIRRIIPEVSLTTDVICGFPGETERDFQETFEFCRQCGFSKMHVFPYSRREGTPAALREDQLSKEVKDERAKALRALAVELRAKDLASRKGSKERAVVEDVGWCMTESYHRVACSPDSKPGSFLDVRL